MISLLSGPNVDITIQSNVTKYLNHLHSKKNHFLAEHSSGKAKVVGSDPIQSLKFFQVIFPVVLWLHSHLSLFHYLIATVGHLLPWYSCPWAEYYVHWTYRAEPTHDHSHVALIAQLVEHCTRQVYFAGRRLQVAGCNLIITGKLLTLKIINNLYTRQGFLHKVVRLFHIVKTPSIRYKYLSINMLKPVKSLQSHLNGCSTNVSIDSRFGSGLPIGLHMRIFILACHWCIYVYYLNATVS